jgi:hypothetical protein
MKQLKHDSAFNEAIDAAEEDLMRADGKEMAQKCPYIFSSDLADAYWLAAYCIYHTGRRPNAMRRSRGHSWLIDLPGSGIMRAYIDKPDQREGVRLVAA